MAEWKKRWSTAFEGVPHMIHGTDYNPDQWLANPEILEEDIKLMKLAGINSVSIGMFAWQALEPEEGVYNLTWLDKLMDQLGDNGIHVILATPSGARPAWMDAAHPEVLRVMENRVRNLHGQRHNHCYTSPYYRNKVQEMNEMLAKRYKDHKALAMWHVSNEYGGDCHCQLCQEAFRGWLRKKYHNDINELNQQWWTSFWSHTYNNFDQIESPASNGECYVHGMNLDWRRFVSDQTLDFYRTECKPLREITPNIPVTTNLQGTFKGFDPWKFADDMDYISWDNYPKWHNPDQKVWETAASVAFVHDINRSLKKGKPFLMMESTPSQVNWHDVNKLKRPGMHILSSMQAIAHGSDSVQYFQWRKSRGASEKLHGAVVDHYGGPETRVFQEVSELGKLLGKLDDIVGTSVKPQVAVIYDWENAWAIDDLQGLNKERQYQETCTEHYQALWRLGIPMDVISMEQDFSDYKLVIAPMLYMVKEGVGDRLKRFVANGGTLVFTYCTGWVNENDLCYLGGFPGNGLMEVAGVWAEELDPLYPQDKNRIVMKENATCSSGVGFASEYEAHSLCERIHPKDGCKVLAVYGDDFYAGEPVVTYNQYEQGHCYYIATRGEQKFYDDFYLELVTKTKLAMSPFGELPEGVNVEVRQAEEADYYFVMNYTSEEQSIMVPEHLVFTDVATEQHVEGELRLGSYGLCVLKAVEKSR